MPLYNELMSAAELTTFARRSQEDIEANQLPLSAFFPNTLVDSDTAKYTIGDTGLTPAAEYRSYDAESTIGTVRGGRNVAVQLPPVSQKNRIGELDTIRGRAGNEAALEKIGRVAADTTSAVLNRVEALRGSVLETGRVTIEENGFYADEDLGRDEDMTTTAGNLWSEGEGTPIDDLIAWAEKYEEKNGVMPGAILASNKVISSFQRSEQVRKAIGGNSERTVATLDEINALLGAYDLPGFTRFGKSVNIGGKPQKVLSENKLFLMPAPGIELGQTVFGVTAEAGSPEYGIATAEAPGVVAGVHLEWDPYAYWVRINALALPVMSNPNASMVAAVLGE